MSEVQKAILEITYLRDSLPKTAFRIIIDNRDEAIPYLA